MGPSLISRLFPENILRQRSVSSEPWKIENRVLETVLFYLFILIVIKAGIEFKHNLNDLSNLI
jgi:hypothetical protein